MRRIEPGLQALHAFGDGGEVPAEAGHHRFDRIVVSPMSQYLAIDGEPGDWHLVHLGKFAMGGAGIVFVEETSVEERASAL